MPEIETWIPKKPNGLKTIEVIAAYHDPVSGATKSYRWRHLGGSTWHTMDSRALVAYFKPAEAEIAA